MASNILYVSASFYNIDLDSISNYIYIYIFISVIILIIEKHEIPKENCEKLKKYVIIVYKIQS